MIDITRFSSLKNFIIVTCYVIRFVNNLKETLKNDDANDLLENTLTIDGIRKTSTRRIPPPGKFPSIKLHPGEFPPENSHPENSHPEYSHPCF